MSSDTTQKINPVPELTIYFYFLVSTMKQSASKKRIWLFEDVFTKARGNTDLNIMSGTNVLCDFNWLEDVLTSEKNKMSLQIFRAWTK